ncbi:MAG: IcmT/TraK family protein [Gammaproteobacteria bacterium]|jgi:intracellular multiplication protein IcmT
MKPISPSAHWRDSARPVRFFIVDYRAMFPLLLCLFIPRWWTLGVALATIIFFALLEHYGFSVRVFLRFLRGVFSGPRKVAKPWWLTRAKY